MTQLDTLVTTGEMQMLKLLLPYIPSSWRGMLAVWLKFTEFKNTLQLFGGFGNASSDVIKGKDIHSPADLLADLQPFMDAGSADSLNMLLNMMSMMNAMKNGDPENPSGFGDPGEMTEMMDLFDNIMKGNDNND